jgi:8-oxo-dGTP pyrophosphatase MutT (NUDIX family)
MRTWDGREVAGEPPFGATVAVWRERDGVREWLVLHRAHHGRDYEGDWAWTPPSGARYPGETIHACARRELVEETGLALDPQPVHLDREWALFVVRASADADVTLDAEHDAFDWLSVDEACARCMPSAVADGLREIASR